MASEDWKRLASYVVARRRELGISTRQELAGVTGVSHRTLGTLENGARVSPGTLASVSNALGWTPDSPSMVLAGGQPTLTQGGQPAFRPPRYASPAHQQIAEAPDLSEEEKRHLMRALDELREMAIHDRDRYRTA